ncbi:conserved hypothetical protein [Histoplasma capsulatum var. duboisii H88]|uniref:Uncharacterized protein n=2 Tax=Ajellomyces capsulatus TaxID=5037 RepID=F0U5T4_AJEC8|nr:conserved hypothetical protein [Histoplasma capsulatum H143]EGC41379.1 conserved hypothetical protein [Histoplasma capsulatum var. duboisii H88]
MVFSKEVSRLTSQQRAGVDEFFELGKHPQKQTQRQNCEKMKGSEQGKERSRQTEEEVNRKYMFAGKVEVVEGKMPECKEKIVWGRSIPLTTQLNKYTQHFLQSSVSPAGVSTADA